MVKVLDASALMAYFEKEPGYEKVTDAFVEAAESGRSLLMNVVNWGEVYYVLARRYHLPKAHELMRLASTFPIEWVVVDLELAGRGGAERGDLRCTARRVHLRGDRERDTTLCRSLVAAGIGICKQCS